MHAKQMPSSAQPSHTPSLSTHCYLYSPGYAHEQLPLGVSQFLTGKMPEGVYGEAITQCVCDCVLLLTVVWPSQIVHIVFICVVTEWSLKAQLWSLPRNN